MREAANAISRQFRQRNEPFTWGASASVHALYVKLSRPKRCVDNILFS